MTGTFSWVGIHRCGGLVSAMPNSSEKERFKCAIESCDSNEPLDEDSYLIFQEIELPDNLTPTDIENLPRDDRRKLFDCESKEKSIELAIELKQNDRLTSF